jgi:RNA polymerase sigma-70 factor (ECF subfamily)
MDAHEQADAGAVAVLLREDARASMPPHPMWYEGRDTIVAGLARGFVASSPHYLGRMRMLPTRANRQPAAAGYLCRPGDTLYRAFGLYVLRVEDGEIAEVIAFSADLFPAFGLPLTL